MAQQAIAEQRPDPQAESATAVGHEVKTGELLAVADYPTVDPNDVDATKDKGAFGSRALTGVVRARLDDQGGHRGGAARPGQGHARPTRPSCPTRARSPGAATIHDAEFHPTENLTLTGILRDSSNVGITELGSRLTRPAALRLHEEVRPVRAGVGDRLPGPAVAWQYGASPNWDQQTSINSMFGQGISTTAMQVASIFQTLANDGVRIPLHFVKGCTTADGKTIDAPDVQKRARRVRRTPPRR